MAVTSEIGVAAATAFAGACASAAVGGVSWLIRRQVESMTEAIEKIGDKLDAGITRLERRDEKLEARDTRIERRLASIDARQQAHELWHKDRSENR